MYENLLKTYVYTLLAGLSNCPAYPKLVHYGEFLNTESCTSVGR